MKYNFTKHFLNIQCLCISLFIFQNHLEGQIETLTGQVWPAGHMFGIPDLQHFVDTLIFHKFIKKVLFYHYDIQLLNKSLLIEAEMNVVEANLVMKVGLSAVMINFFSHETTFMYFVCVAGCLMFETLPVINDIQLLYFFCML